MAARLLIHTGFGCFTATTGLHVWAGVHTHNWAWAAGSAVVGLISVGLWREALSWVSDRNAETKRAREVEHAWSELCAIRRQIAAAKAAHRPRKDLYARQEACMNIILAGGRA